MKYLGAQMTNEMNYLQAMEKYGIPAHMQVSLGAYLISGRPVGHFLTAVIENDLKGAVAHADEENQKAIVGYVKFLYNHAPMKAWGYKDATKEYRAYLQER